MAEEKDQQDDTEGQGSRFPLGETEEDVEGQQVKFLKEGDAEGKSDEDDAEGEGFKMH